MSLDSQILRALRSTEASVSGADLSHRLGISRAAVWARIEEMRRLGYDISASPHLGYKLVSVPDVLHPDELRSRLPESVIIGREIHVYQETTSTNDVVEKFARDGVREGVVVFAESQTKGRGRLGRKWLSPSGKGLWFSILLRPQLRPQCATQLTIAAGTAIRRAISIHTGIEPEIKWPNDILIKKKKVAGILTELNAELDGIRYLILGIGVDVNQSHEDFPPDIRPIATSLSVETKRPILRAELACQLLTELNVEYQKIASKQFHTVAQEWQENCSTLSQQVSIRMGERCVKGVAEALDEDGALLLRTEHGHLERIIGGDVTMEKR
ncbi:MAG: Bifunctional ligase/repressor BirA [Verrucomicrobiales bacterium]|nr:Bifunctional ligase/repressor BirA [Verrucomicrobiales bacterium]MDB6131024.1 Bifunctional ligase/repressor BirA [Verrucomicrobiales bacterium]